MLRHDRYCIDRAKSPHLLKNTIAITVPYRRCAMKSPTFVAELRERLGAPSSETVEGLRMLKAFVKLSPRQRLEVIELVERLAIDATGVSDHPLS
jgi:hypothetical protein